MEVLNIIRSSSMIGKPAHEEDRFPSIDQFLCFSIYSAGHALTRLYRPLLDKIGLTYPQYLVMVALWSKDDQTVKDLGQTLFLDSSTLTPLLKRLEGAGHLTRTRDPEDERQVRVGLTNEGRLLKNRARHIPACIEAALGLSTGTIEKIQSGVAGIRDRLKELQ
jgi:DNA-binding MarR family transcriptional regulator